MSDSTSYIIVPPDDPNVAIKLQELIEGLQSGRLVVGSDNVLVDTQPNDESQEEEDEEAQIVLAVPEEAAESQQTLQAQQVKQEPMSTNNSMTLVVKNSEDNIVQQQIITTGLHDSVKQEEQVSTNTSVRLVVKNSEDNIVQQQIVSTGLPDSASLVEVSEDDFLNAVGAETLHVEGVTTDISAQTSGVNTTGNVIQAPADATAQQVIIEEIPQPPPQQIVTTTVPRPIIRKVIKRVIVPGNRPPETVTTATSTAQPQEGKTSQLMKALTAGGKPLIQTQPSTGAKQIIQTVVRPVRQVAAQRVQATAAPTQGQVNQSNVGTTQHDNSIVRTILLSPKEAQRTVQLSSPAAAQRQVSTVWQATAEEADLLSSLSAAARSQYSEDPEWVPEDQEPGTVSMRPIAGEKRFACNFCSRTFKFASSIKRHLWTHTGEKPFKCGLCSFRCNREHNLKAHIILKHCRTHAPYTCDKCHKGFVSQSDLRKHMHSHSSHEYFKCGICGDRFHHSNTFRKHVANTHKGELFENPYMCAVCNIPFETPGIVLQHVNSVHLQVGLVCRYCGETFTRNDNLVRHEAEHEQREPPKRIKIASFIQDVIEKSKIEQTLTGIVEEPTGEENEDTTTRRKMVKKFECSYCGKYCSSRAKLKSHICKQHTNTGYYKCPESDCERHFAFPSDVRDHLLKVHSKDRLECYCGVKFNMVGDLKRHVAQKLTGKMFECRKCHSLFSEADMLQNHLISDVHSGDGVINQPYMCSKCDQVFSTLTDLSEHVQIHLGEAVTEKHGHAVLEMILDTSEAEALENDLRNCRIVQVPYEPETRHYTKQKKTRRVNYKPRDRKKSTKAEDSATADVANENEIKDLEGYHEQQEDFSVLTVTGADNESHELQVPNEFSGQIVVEKEGFKDVHIVKDGKAIQKYSVRIYPDGREVNVDDEFAVIGVPDGAEKTQEPETSVASTIDPSFEAKSNILVPINSTPAPQKSASTEPTTELDLLAAAGAAIPEAVTQTVVSSEPTNNEYQQLLQAGLAHGGVQASDIPQVVDALEGATLGLESANDLTYQALTALTPKRKKSTAQHARTMTGGLKCRFCDRVWKFPSELKKHESTHIGSRPFSCSVCGKRFARKTALKEHKTTHRGEIGDEEQGKIVCPICEGRFLYKSRLARHIIVKHGTMDFSKLDPALQEVLQTINADGYNLVKARCDICNKVVANMRRHLMSHDDVREFVCNHEGCGKAFKRLVHLRDHAAIHLGSKRPRIACRKCNHTTFKKGDMENHMVVVHGAKPKFTCNNCGKGFGDSNRYTQHMKIHLPFNERQTYACDLCGRIFKHPASVKYHIQKVHVTLGL